MAALLAHRYGPNIRLLDDPFLSTLLARVGAPKVGTAELPSLVRTAHPHGDTPHPARQRGVPSSAAPCGDVPLL